MRLSTATRRSTASNSDFEGLDSPVASGSGRSPNRIINERAGHIVRPFFCAAACGRSGADRGQTAFISERPSHTSTSPRMKLRPT